MTEKEARIDKTFFYKYFRNRDIAHAFELGEITVFKKPKELPEVGFDHAPQLFVYVD